MRRKLGRLVLSIVWTLSSLEIRDTHTHTQTHAYTIKHKHTLHIQTPVYNII